MDYEDAYMISQDYKHLVDELYEGTVSGEIDLDKIMFNVTRAILLLGGPLLGIQVRNPMLRGSLRGVLTKKPHMLKW